MERIGRLLIVFLVLRSKFCLSVVDDEEKLISFHVLLFSRPQRTHALPCDDEDEEEEEEEEDVLEMMPTNPISRRKPTLRKQMSILEVPSDESGLFKMTHWV